MSGVSQIQGGLGFFTGLVVWGFFFFPVWFRAFLGEWLLFGVEGCWICFDFLIVWFLRMDLLKRKHVYLKHTDKLLFSEQNQNPTRGEQLWGQSRACPMQFSAPFSPSPDFSLYFLLLSLHKELPPKPKIQPVTSASFSDKEGVQFIKAAQTPEHISKQTSRSWTVTAFVSFHLSSCKKHCFTQ